MSADGSRSRAGIAVGLGVAFVAVAVAAAVVFTNRQGASTVAAQGTIALRAEAAIGAASAVRNGAAQMALLHELSSGAAGVEERQLELFRLATSLRSRGDDLAVAIPEAASAQRAASAVSGFGAVVEGFPALLERSGADAAMASVDSAYSALLTELAAVRAESTAELAAASNEAGRVADAARFFVAFFIPLGAVLAYRRRSRREEERRTLELQLESEREVGRAKDEFMANLSHELRTPLTGIYGFALALESDGLEEPTTARELVGLIVDESAELNRMVDDLIAVGRLEGGEIDFFPEVVHPKAELDAVLASFRRSGVTFDVSLDDQPILADPGRLRQVLRNLVSNAVKHGGPSITVTGSVEPAGRDRYTIEVSDDGPGVPEHVRERIFERYVHAGSQPLIAGSVGLGLAIAHSFAAGMGGSLTYERRGGQTVFVLDMPLAVD